MILTIDMSNLSPEDAAEYLHARVEAMCRGEVYVRAHYRQVPGWDSLPARKRVARKARYAVKLTKSVAAAAELTKLPEPVVRAAIRRKR